MTVDNSRFSYYNPAEYLDRAALAAASTEVGALPSLSGIVSDVNAAPTLRQEKE